MAGLSDLPFNWQALLPQLFRSDNYCFATNTPDRSPTFYSAKGWLAMLNTAVLCGRVRTQHSSGPLIDITQSAKKHFFSSSRSRRGRIADRFAHRLSVEGVDKICARCRMVPVAGDHHFEGTMVPARDRTYSRRHKSGGTGVWEPRFRLNETVIGLIERVLAGQCNVHLNGETAFQCKGPHTGMIRGLGIGAYLDTL